MRSIIGTFAIHALCTGAVLAQSSSLLLAPGPQLTNGANGNDQAMSAPNGQAVSGEAMFVTSDPRDEVLPMTRALEGVSLYAIPVQIPRKFKVEDLVTIIVRQQKKYEADAELEAKKSWALDGKLSEWFRFHDDIKHLGSDNLSNGQPGFKFDYGNDYKGEGTSDREDRFTTRITATIIDVKPNGNLVLEAALEEQHDDEAATLTITGTCRSTDVTPDNTVLSTQIALLRIVEKNKGNVKDGSRPGFIPRILNFGGGPF